MRTTERLVSMFPAIVLGASLIALWHPAAFTWFTGSLITVGLGIIMLGMGLTLTVDDFRRVLRLPAPVFAGVLLQFTVMPLMGWASARAFGLPAPLAAGLILVACCPGGTASNVICYIARADVPLSVTMTSVSTMLAVGVTPALTTLLVGKRVDVNTVGLLLDCAKVIILPVTAGVLLNRYLPRLTARIVPFAPVVAVLAIALIVASVIGAGRGLILRSGAALLLSVFTLHAGGFFFGYLFSWALFRKVIPARTVSIEVGMQNSGLGVVLARNNFADPSSAIPCAISSLFHSLIASVLAGIWRRSAGRAASGDSAAAMS